ncbi:unnamed protein product, partial [Gulo gulo]
RRGKQAACLLGTRSCDDSLSLLSCTGLETAVSKLRSNLSQKPSNSSLLDLEILPEGCLQP